MCAISFIISKTSQQDSAPMVGGVVHQTLDEPIGFIQFTEVYGFEFVREPDPSITKFDFKCFEADWQAVRSGYLKGEGTFDDSGACVCPKVVGTKKTDFPSILIAILDTPSFQAVRNAVINMSDGQLELDNVDTFLARSVSKWQRQQAMRIDSPHFSQNQPQIGRAHV